MIELRLAIINRETGMAHFVKSEDITPEEILREDALQRFVAPAFFSAQGNFRDSREKKTKP